MVTRTASTSHELDIFRRIVDPDQPFLSPAAAEAILRLDFSPADRKRMNDLADKNRSGRLTDAEDDELTSYIRVGQVLGVLQSKARRSLPRALRTRRKS